MKSHHKDGNQKWESSQDNLACENLEDKKLKIIKIEKIIDLVKMLFCYVTENYIPISKKKVFTILFYVKSLQ